jgi:hypothetical protein
MSIWKTTQGEKYLSAINVKVKRMVENQYRNSTRHLVDNIEEQEILEEELEKSKPPYPANNSKGKLHWLLFTPFRYPPLNGGGRFHTRAEQSIFYGAIELETAMAEIAYKRFVFRACSEANIKPSDVEYTAFSAEIKTNKGIKLTDAPFEQYKNNISSPLSHIESQVLGSEMRNAGVEAFLFFSARYENGINCGIIDVEAFANNDVKNKDMSGWVVYDSEDVVEFRRDVSMTPKNTKIFYRKDFLVGGSLPMFS